MWALEARPTVPHGSALSPTTLPLYGSFKIGSAFGIPVRLHWTFLAFLYLLVILWGGNLATLFLLGVLFGCVLLHELGHSLVARRFGIRVVDITFWPLGGMARMSEMPESSKVEGLVAIAGPAVNFALAALGLIALAVMSLAPAGQGPFGVVWLFVQMNLMLGTFNLIPAFPMDGGRILRAWFARKNDWLRATELAVSVGRACAGIMLVGSIVLMWLIPNGFCILPLIALFVWFAGGRELLSVRLRHAQRAYGRAAGPGGAWFGFEPAGPADGPGAGWNDPRQAPGQGGFSEEDVRALERYRGRFRRPPSDA